MSRIQRERNAQALGRNERVLGQDEQLRQSKLESPLRPKWEPADDPGQAAFRVLGEGDLVSSARS